jgi:hypothetical protein
MYVSIAERDCLIMTNSEVSLDSVKFVTHDEEEFILNPKDQNMIIKAVELRAQPNIWNTNQEFEIEFESDFYIDDGDKKYLFGYDNSKLPSRQSIIMIYYKPVIVQARRHKKKRINKKWLKRYGYKNIYMREEIKLDECEVMPNEDGSIEFISRYRGGL